MCTVSCCVMGRQLLLFIQLCPTLCDPMDCSTPGFPVLHYLPELTQPHVHWFGDAIQPSRPLSAISSSVVPFSSCLQSSPASGSFLMSQLFTSSGQSIGASTSASDLPMKFQGQFSLGLTDLISFQSKGLLRFFSNTTVQKHQFLGTHLSVYFNSHICLWILEKLYLWLYWPLSAV